MLRSTVAALLVTLFVLPTAVDTTTSAPGHHVGRRVPNPYVGATGYRDPD